MLTRELHCAIQLKEQRICKLSWHRTAYYLNNTYTKLCLKTTWTQTKLMYMLYSGGFKIGQLLPAYSFLGFNVLFWSGK